MSVHLAPVTSPTIVVAVDVGKTSAVRSATDSARQRVFGPVEFAMTRSGGQGCTSSGRDRPTVCAGEGGYRSGGPGEEARDLADELGDGFGSRCCRWFLCVALIFEGDLDGAVTQLSGVVSEADAAHDGSLTPTSPTSTPNSDWPDGSS